MKYSNKPNKNERSTESKYMQPSMRRINRDAKFGRKNRKTMVMQEIPAMVRFTPKKKYSKTHMNISVPLSARRDVRKLKQFVSDGLGKVEYFSPKSIWHSAGVTV